MDYKKIISHYLTQLFGEESYEKLFQELSNMTSRTLEYVGEIDPNTIMYSENGQTTVRTYQDIARNVLTIYIMKNKQGNKAYFKITGNNNLEHQVNTLKTDHYGLLGSTSTINENGIEYTKGSTTYRCWYIQPSDKDFYEEESTQLKTTKDMGNDFKKMYEIMFNDEDSSLEEKLCRELAVVRGVCHNMEFDGRSAIITTPDITIIDKRSKSKDDGYNIGKYKIKIDLTSKSVNIRISHTKFPERGVSYHHPHVSGRNMCTGGFADIISKSRQTKDISIIYNILIEFLSVYNNDSPHMNLTNFLEQLREYA